MNVSLPSNRRNEIEALVQGEYGITGGHLGRARRISVVTGLLGLGTAVAFGYCLGRVSHGGVAFAYFVSGIAPAIVAVTSHTLLRRWVLSWAIPEWQAYVTEKTRRVRQASERFRSSMLHSSDYWRGLDQAGFKCEFARLLQGYGCLTQIMDGSSDTGIDIVAGDESGSVAIRCGNDQERLSPSVARELYGAIVAGNYSSGILATTAEVSGPVRDFIRGKPIRVIDLPELIRMQTELDAKRDQERGVWALAGKDLERDARERT